VHKIKWSNNLSVGVDQIDDDHKELITIINKMINEVDKNNNLLMQYFDELEDYTHYHFSREEKLMISQCTSDEDRAMVKEHLKEHQYFIKKIPELKQKVVSSSSSDIVYEVIDFLMDWLLEHIIVKDLGLSQCFTSNQSITKNKNNNIFSSFIESINKKFSLYRKVFLLIAIPLLMLFGLLFLQSSIIYNKYTKLNHIEEKTESYIGINTLINSLQKERGYSNGLIDSKYTNFKKRLSAQRKLTSSVIIENKPKRKILKQYLNIDIIAKELNKIEVIRSKIDSKEINRDETNKYYTNLISKLINIVKNINHTQKDIYNARVDSSLVTLLYLKENEGVIRHKGLQKLLLPHSASIEFKKYLLIRDHYKKYLSLFASDSLLKSLKKINESKYFTDIKNMEKIIMEDNNTQSITGMKWFDMKSIEIDAYSKIINNELKNIYSYSKHKKESYLFYIIILLLSIIVVLFISFILIYALRKSIVTPIEEITIAMQNLIKGNKSFYFNTHRRDDLIGQMIIAFNNLRRVMIKSDYTKVLLDIKDEQVNNYEKLSYIDPLTNLFNRRKYIESLKIQTERSNKIEKALSLLIVDIDKFKSINDSFGHDVGDHILKAFADSLKSIIQDSGIVTRIGGEEFAIILPDTSKNEAIKISKKIIKYTREAKYRFMNKNISVTVSIGVSIYKNDSSIEEFIKIADTNLYKAKNTGRNKVCY
jgi:diguanylate cyclase (GGDEF)-like protein/hemerythrin-like metal-binding protein